MLKRIWIKFWPGILLTIVVVIFFNKILFFGETFINPDYGRSDLLHFNIPIRYSAWEAVRNFEIPFWEPRIGQGFPLLDEGQVGFFYLPNLLFSFLPFWLSFNVGLVFTFIMAAVGTYLLSRSFKISEGPALLAGLTYAFSPILILRLHHYNLIQSAAIFPLILWSLNSFFNSKKIVYFGIFALLLSQQIFIGFQQITTYTAVASILFFIFKVQTNYKKKGVRLKVGAVFFGSITLAVLIAAVQVNSTLTLLNASSRIQSQTPQKILSDFPLNPSNLKTLIDPFILGNANNASYPRWIAGQWGIFWENNLYFGLSQLALIFVLTLEIIRRKIDFFNKNLFFFYFLGVLGILLALGKFAPFHPIFSIPPISFFRVPSRFLILTFLSAAILSSAGLEHVKNLFKNTYSKSIVISIILMLSIFDVFRVWYQYPATVKVKDLQEAPQFAKQISSDSRTGTFGQTKEWNNIFLQKGWEGQEEKYLFFKNLMDQNLNIIYGVNNTFSYAAMSPRRSAYIESIIKQNAKENENSLAFSPLAQKLLDISNTKYVISTKKIESQRLELLNNVKKDDLAFYLYINRQSLPRVFTVSNYQSAKTLDQIIGILNSEQFDPNKEVVLEEPLQIKPSNNANIESKVELQKHSRNLVVISTSTSEDSILVLSDSYYPGWKATIDDESTKVFPANINSRAIILPKGNHTIQFKYAPERLGVSALVSAFSLMALGIMIIKYRDRRLLH